MGNRGDGAGDGSHPEWVCHDVLQYQDSTGGGLAAPESARSHGCKGVEWWIRFGKRAAV